MSNSNFPFFDTKIPVCSSLANYRLFIKNYSGFHFCPYIADKDKESWEKSTSRVYMNKVLPKFLYIPLNISKNDTKSLKKFFEEADNDSKIVAVNITQPHKSNPVLMKMYLEGNKLANIDTLIRKNGKLLPYDLNSEAFIDWYKDEVGSFINKVILLVGVGGVGEPTARRLAKLKPSKLILADPVDKSYLLKTLLKTADVVYTNSLDNVDNKTFNEIIVINAAGKEGGEDSSLLKFLQALQSKKVIFVDLRPQLEIDIVEKAKKLGIESYTGYGMNARNDYILLTGIADNLKVKLPSFIQFKTLVKEAS
jgi:shikimate 5-dehydrogenase